MRKTYTILLLLIASVSGSAQPLQGTMETWRTYNSGIPLIYNKQLEAPAGWHGLDSLIMWAVPFIKLASGSGTPTLYKQVYKSTDSHGGSHAAMLITRTQDTLGLVPGILANAQIDVDINAISGGGDPMDALSYSGGTTVTSRIASVNAWVKYTPKGNDSGMCMTFAALAGQGAGGRDSIVGTGGAAIGASSSYREIQVPLTYTDAGVVPDKIVIVFMSSAGTDGADSSMLYVDDVSMTESVGVTDPADAAAAFRCYPNPASGRIYLKTTSAVTYHWQITDASGRMVFDRAATGNSSADLSGHTPGIYFYDIRDRSGRTLHSGRMLLTR